MNFIEFCEQLWSSWKSNQLSNDWNISTNFGLDYCPEPYLSFKGNIKNLNDKSIIFLTSNPGGCDPFQKNDEVFKNNVIKSNESYFENSYHLANHYLVYLKKSAKALIRIKKMIDIGEHFKADNIIQVEAFPIHSHEFKTYEKELVITKSKLEGNIINDYCKSLRDFLIDKNVVAISSWNENWQIFQADIMGLKDSKRKAVAVKNDKETGVLQYATYNNKFKSLVALQGSNNLPSQVGLNLIKTELDKI